VKSTRNWVYSLWLSAIIIGLLVLIIGLVGSTTSNKTSTTASWGKMPLPHGTQGGILSFNGSYGKLYLHFWNGRNQWSNRDSVHHYYIWHTMPASRLTASTFMLNDHKTFTLEPNRDTISTFLTTADSVSSNELRYAYSGKHPNFSNKVWTWSSGPDVFWDLAIGRPLTGLGSDFAYTWVAGTRYEVASDTLYWTFVPLNQ